MSILNSNDHFADESTEAPNLDAGTDTPILTTKLFRPLVTRDLIPRTHLLQRLEHSRERPLTLISAPPGYGKSALASAWVETSGRPHAWVSLDETDNDLRTFVAYLIAALNKAFPHLVWKSQLMVHAPILPPADKVARTLLLDLQQIQTPCFIVLDDLHVITENAIYELLSEYLRHPPQFVHLLLIGRVDPSLPIATMRARGEVTEVRARDLRFSADEAAQLLSQLLAREIDEAVTADWVSRTEGWVAALRLAALSLRHRGAADELQSDFNGDNRYLQEYLLAEVLQGLPSGFRKCLIKISVLDRFCNALCTALCQCDGASRPTELSTPGLVQWMQKNNLFLVPLDDQHQWFRFHHLFQRLLRDQLQATFAEEEIAMLHLCAAEWLEDHRFPGEAFQHALAANDTEAATEIVTRHRYDLMNTDQWHRLGRWLKALPGHVVADNPVLMITLGQIGLFAGQDAEVINTPKEAERLLAIRGADTATRDAVTGEIAVLQAIRDLAYGKPISAIAGAQLGLQLLPQRAQYSRALAIGVNAMSLQCMGDLSRGVEMIRQTLAEPAWPDNIKARLSFYLATVFAMEGHLEQVIASARKCLSISDRLYLPATSSYGRYFVGVSHYLRNEFDEAETQLAALHADRAISAPSYAAAGTIALALIHMARGEMDEAERVIGQMKAYLQNLNDTFAQVLMEAFGVELALSKGDLVKAR